jgi:hypothetical protein
VKPCATLPAVMLGAVLCAAPLAGCHRGPATARLRVMSRSPEGGYVDGSFSRISYGGEAAGEPVITASDTSLEQLRTGDADAAQALMVAFLWRPKPGETPIDPTATNLSLMYTILSHGEIGVYGGGGFGRARGKSGDRTLQLTIEASSLRLLRATPGFVDRLGHTSITGTLRAERDPGRTRQMRLALERLGDRAATSAKSSE